MKFKCSGCGGCCRFVGFVPEAKGVLPITPDGSCAYLVNNKCSIYDKRPDICRVDKMTFNIDGLSRKEYYKKSTKACHEIIDALGLDKSYKINIDDYDK